MPITREQWAEVESAVYEFWDIQTKKKKDYNALLYNVQNSNKSQENYLGVGSAGHMAPQTDSLTHSQHDALPNCVPVTVWDSSGLQLEEEIFRFEEYNKIEQRTRLLNDAVYKTLQAHGVSTFNNAFDATFKGPDGVALCSAAHPYSPSDATVQSNLFSLDLTMPNLKKVYNAMLDFRDDKGDLLFTTPNILLTGIQYREEALKICGPQAGDKEPFTAENDANIYKGDLTPIFHPMIQGKKWFLIDGDMMKNYLYWYNARKPVIETDGDFDTEVMKFKTVGMWSYGWDFWAFLVGSNAG